MIHSVKQHLGFRRFTSCDFIQLSLDSSNRSKSRIITFYQEAPVADFQTIGLQFLNSFLLLLMLLNPFLIILYMMDLVQDLTAPDFRRVLIRASWISFVVFVMFAFLGNAVFRYLFQSSFASFQIFGGIIFLIIGVRFVFTGNDVMRNLRGKPEHVAGSIAMPIMIGPGTVSASIFAGNHLPFPFQIIAIFLAIVIFVLVILILKQVHDFVKPRNERLIERYVEITGKLAALIVGTFAVEMIMNGIQTWIQFLR